MYIFQLTEKLTIAGHVSSDECLPDCPKVPLEEFLENCEDFGCLNNQYIGTFINSVSQKLDAVRSLLQCSSSTIFSKEYYFYVHFSLSGEAIIQGVVWPLHLAKINHVRLLNGVNSEEALSMEKDLVKIVDKSISTSSDTRTLMEQFNLTEEGAQNVADLVRKNQINLECADPSLPALKTVFHVPPMAEENIKTSCRFLKSMKRFLTDLSADEKQTISTVEFLEQVWKSKVTSSEVLENKVWRIVMQNEEFLFHMEPKLRHMMEQEFPENLSAAYHFALGCSSNTFSVVLRRKRIVNCFTKAFHPIILKAFESPCIIEPINGSVDFAMKYEDCSPFVTVEIPNHRMISVTEAFSLGDARKCRVRSSRSTEFVYSGPTKQISLRKVAAYTEECFKVDGPDPGYYEVVNTFVTRYFLRLNGRSMLLSEFATHYDKQTKEESEQLFEIYSDKITSITMSDEKSILGEPFPDIILCSNGDALKKRRNFKILISPMLNEEAEVQYSKVLLYYPLETLDQLSGDSVEGLYRQRVPDTDEETTIVAKNER